MGHCKVTVLFYWDKTGVFISLLKINIPKVCLLSVLAVPAGDLLLYSRLKEQRQRRGALLNIAAK